MALPRGAVGLSAVYDCGISWRLSSSVPSLDESEFYNMGSK